MNGLSLFISMTFILSFLSLFFGHWESVRFYHLYCRFCEQTVMPEIWKKNAVLLPEDISIQNVMMKWDVLPTSWLQNDILGCILPNKSGKILLQPRFIHQKCTIFYFILHIEVNSITLKAILPNDSSYNNYCLKLFLTQDMASLKLEWCPVNLNMVYFYMADLFKNILGELFRWGDKIS